MGIESTFACNRLNVIGLAEKGESGFRTSSQPMIVGISHTQRPPRQRLSSNAAVFIDQELCRMQSILPPSAAKCCHQKCNVMLPPSAITKGCAKSHPRRRRAVASSGRSGRCRSQSLESKVRFADYTD